MPDEDTQALADLLARRCQILLTMIAEQQRLARQRPPHLHRSIERLIAALQRELPEIDAAIKADVYSSQLWREQEARYRSVPGIGPIIARTVIGELPELGTLDRR